MVHIFTAYVLERWSVDSSANFTVKTVCLIKSADLEKYSYSGYGIGFDSCSFFSYQNFDCGKNIANFR